MRPHLHWAPLSNGPLTRISDTQVFSTEVKLLTACLHVRLGGETPFYKKAAKSHVVFVDSHIKHVCAAWLCISINGRQKTMYRNLSVRHNMFHLRRLRHVFFFYGETHKQVWLFESRRGTLPQIRKSPASLAKASIHKENGRPRRKNTQGFTPTGGSGAILHSQCLHPRFIRWLQQLKIKKNWLYKSSGRCSEVRLDFSVYRNHRKNLNLVFYPRKWRMGRYPVDES